MNPSKEELGRSSGKILPQDLGIIMALRQEQVIQKICGSVIHWGHLEMVPGTEDL